MWKKANQPGEETSRRENLALRTAFFEEGFAERVRDFYTRLRANGIWNPQMELKYQNPKLSGTGISALIAVMGEIYQQLAEEKP